MSFNTNSKWIEEVDFTLKPTVFLVQHTLKPTRDLQPSQDLPQALAPEAKHPKSGTDMSGIQVTVPLAHLDQKSAKQWHEKDDDEDSTAKLVVDEIQQLDNIDNETRAFHDHMIDFDEELANLCGTIYPKQLAVGGSHRSAEFSPRRWWNDVKAFDNPKVGDSAMTSGSSLTMIDSDTPGVAVYDRGAVSSLGADLGTQKLIVRRSSACVPVPAGHLRRVSAEQPISESIRQRVMTRNNSTPEI